MFFTGPRILFLRGSVVSHAADVRAQLAQAPDPGRTHAILRTLHRSHEKAAFLRFSGGTNRRLRVRSAGISVSMERRQGQAKRAGANTIRRKGQGRKRTGEKGRGANEQQTGQARRTGKTGRPGKVDKRVEVGAQTARLQGAKMTLGRALALPPGENRNGRTRKKRQEKDRKAKLWKIHTCQISNPGKLGHGIVSRSPPSCSCFRL
ncbi:hypothetical protein CLUG_02028 [Clavispora lusitaniae ATCC 42720]|uniref:Uncharacterized protein n=1 Tax=Clavispora lusitaniae (strain ATCC 42720) TaxID=306902 RepID=C4Y1E6_CLAL4|nr:uncharacterized protein CLUG_02028 [Clavispora lusitaniae ATCC 42720]EEQ37906.1 hypothetical protein CLUG_02028 [Clavispora lusitaniae ATCC 42720]